MCGIVGYVGGRQAYPILIKGLQRLEYRGYDSAGVALVNDSSELVDLPGIGEKTAECYAEHVLGLPAVIADTHFVRVARRLGFTDTDDRAKAAREIRERFPSSQWSRMSMVVNLHGRTVCRPKPRCMECPVRTLCPSSDAASAGP